MSKDKEKKATSRSIHNADKNSDECLRLQEISAKTEFKVDSSDSKQKKHGIEIIPSSAYKSGGNKIQASEAKVDLLSYKSILSQSKSPHQSHHHHHRQENHHHHNHHGHKTGGDRRISKANLEVRKRRNPLTFHHEVKKHSYVKDSAYSSSSSSSTSTSSSTDEEENTRGKMSSNIWNKVKESVDLTKKEKDEMVKELKKIDFKKKKKGMRKKSKENADRCCSWLLDILDTESDEDIEKELSEVGNAKKSSNTSVNMPIGNKKRDSHLIEEKLIQHAALKARSHGILPNTQKSAFDPLSSYELSRLTYEQYTKFSKKSFPSNNIPDDLAAKNLFESLVPLLKDSKKDSIAAADALDEFRVKKFYEQDGEKRPKRKLSAIRQLPTSLANRRELHANIMKVHQQETSFWKRLDYTMNNLRVNIASAFDELFNKIELWHAPLHFIDETFGVSAAYYFRWIRSVIYLNIVYSFFTFSFIIIPAFIRRDYHNTILSSGNSSIIRIFIDVLLGEGYIHDQSTFFYGTYKSVTVDSKGNSFSSPALIFVVVTFAIIFVNTLFIGAKVHDYYRRVISRVSSGDRAEEVNFLALVISAWDFNITSHGGIKAQKRTISRDFNHVLKVYEERLDMPYDEDSSEDGVDLKEKFEGGRFTRFWAINIGVLAVSCTVGYAFFLMLLYRESAESHKASVLEASIAVLISSVTHLLAILLTFVMSYEKFESYNQRSLAHIIRLSTLYVTIMAVLYGFWIQNSREASNNDNYCWERDTGAEIYRIIIFEGITSGVMNLIRYIIFPPLKAKWMKRRVVKQEFDVEFFTLNLVFIHTLGNLGIFFFPFIPFFLLIRSVITFYLNKTILVKHCTFPTLQLHPSEVYVTFLVTFFGSYLFTTISNIWLIAEVTPSKKCGPFTDFSNKSYSAVLEEYSDTRSGAFLAYLVSPWYMYLIIFITCGVAYNFKIWTRSKHNSIRHLHKLLRLEKVDREFLLRAMFSIPTFGLLDSYKSKTEDRNNKKDKSSNASSSDDEENIYEGIQSEELQKRVEELADFATKIEKEGEFTFKSSLPPHGRSKATEEINAALKSLLLSKRASKTLKDHPKRLSKAGEIYSNVIETFLKKHSSGSHKDASLAK